MDKASPKVGILIVVVVLILASGGFAVWKVLGTKEDERSTSINQEQEVLPPITGRTDATSEETNIMTKDLVQRLLGQQTIDPNKPPPIAVLQTSKEGKALIEERVRDLQMNETTSNKIRAVHQVGRTLVDTSSWTTKAINAIGNMFGQLHNVDKDNFLTYPIFGKHETKGAPLRAELQGFLDQDWRGYNLSMKRHQGSAHWIGQLSLNLIYGSQDAHVHSADNIWWGVGGESARKGLDFFKAVNGHDVKNKRLLEMQDQNGKKIHNNLQINQSGTRGIFGAGVMYAFVQSWMNEMDYFDDVTEQTAIMALIKEGYLIKLSKGAKMSKK